MSALTAISGIGPILSDRLAGAGVGSVEALLARGASSEGRRSIALRSGLDESDILKFVGHADLLRVRGMRGEYAALLTAAGVDTVPALARRNTTNLAARLHQANDAKRLVSFVPPELCVAEWVQQARTMTRVVH